jgi:hypothetical protein
MRSNFRHEQHLKDLTASERFLSDKAAFYIQY